MYLRPVHTELHLPTLYKFIRENPLGVLTTAIKSEKQPLLQSSHIPWVLDIPDPSSSGPQPAKLRGHMARANPHAKTLSEAASLRGSGAGGALSDSPPPLEEEVMVLFTSPVQHYVTPKFYTETKPATGKVVPTWDYAAVQAYGRLRVYFDSAAPETAAFLAKQIDDLSRHSEEKIMGYDGNEGRVRAWSVNEAPESYLKPMKKAIIGVEIEITRLHGKWKMSQELTNGDREGVINGFEQLGTERGKEMAETVRERGALKDEGRKE